MEMNFCRRCGSKLEQQAEESAYRCAKGHMVFAGAAPAQGVLFVRDRRVLLAERAIDPGKGKLDMPGGFCALYETFEQTAERELQEELGLTRQAYGPLHYVLSINEPYRFRDETKPVLGVVFWAELRSDASIRPGDDLAGAYEFVTSAVVPERLAFEGIKLGLARLKALDLID